jgi:4-hydroxy-4-methyl-2-oxoglutarate aldolase
MFTIKPMPPGVDAGLLDRLVSVDVPDLGHLRYWGSPDPRIRPVLPGRKIVGTAVTVIAPALDSSIIPHALGLIRPGDILIVDRLGDDRHACMGGVVALAAKIAGAAGIIVDGWVTDFDEIRQHGLPVWCRGEAGAMSKLLAIGGAMNIPVNCGGVAVTPGDAVIADDCGICVLAPDEITDMHAAAMDARSKRPARLPRILAGEKLGSVNGVSARIEAALAKSMGGPKP